MGRFDDTGRGKKRRGGDEQGFIIHADQQRPAKMGRFDEKERGRKRKEGDEQGFNIPADQQRPAKMGRFEDKKTGRKRRRDVEPGFNIPERPTKETRYDAQQSVAKSVQDSMQAPPLPKWEVKWEKKKCDTVYPFKWRGCRKGDEQGFNQPADGEQPAKETRYGALQNEAKRAQDSMQAPTFPKWKGKWEKKLCNPVHPYQRRGCRKGDEQGFNQPADRERPAKEAISNAQQSGAKAVQDSMQVPILPKWKGKMEKKKCNTINPYKRREISKKIFQKGPYVEEIYRSTESSNRLKVQIPQRCPKNNEQRFHQAADEERPGPSGLKVKTPQQCPRHYEQEFDQAAAEEMSTKNEIFNVVKGWAKSVLDFFFVPLWPQMKNKIAPVDKAASEIIQEVGVEEASKVKEASGAVDKEAVVFEEARKIIREVVGEVAREVASDVLCTYGRCNFSLDDFIFHKIIGQGAFGR
ncbi:hypothetical protein AB205_0116490, partial [Aquarana catesbeiana]